MKNKPVKEPFTPTDQNLRCKSTICLGKSQISDWKFTKLLIYFENVFLENFIDCSIFGFKFYVMLRFPNAKINLGLNIIEKRPDGYHNLASVFYPIGWSDALEIVPADVFSFTHSGLTIPGKSDKNLIVKAFSLLKSQGFLAFDCQVAMHLHKVIPMGAGIGGGSSDGAFALKMLNEIFGLNLSLTQLQGLAAHLGSDCAFFIENKPMYCFGKGNEFEPVSLTLKGKYLVLLNPQVHVSTAEAYSGVQPKEAKVGVKEAILRPVEEWPIFLKNDFEAKVMAKYPKIRKMKELLYQYGAQYAAMTGSGSTVFGIFETPPFLDPNQLQGVIIWEEQLTL
jgi:4-diphosphocytidyl-2-C-methyl-D-erythritol kinase